MRYDYDLLVIGSGPAGEKGAAQAAYFGKRAAVIEKEPQPGGAAVHTGTLPSKTLRETAVFLAGHRQRDLYGVSVTLEAGVAVQRLIARKDAVRQAEVERIHWNLARHGIDLVKGTARVLDGHRVEVTSRAGVRVISAAFILVATGSYPSVPEHIRAAGVDDSDSILRIDQLPGRLVIYGGGVIGSEYASVFAELGVEVTLVDARERPLPFLDPDLGAVVGDAMAESGVTLVPSETVEAVERDGEELVVRLCSGRELRADRFLWAAGRSGATRGLGLEAVGVEIGERGHIKVDTNFRSAVPTILAAGDVIGPPALASTSMEQGRVAVCRAFGFDYKREVDSLLPSGIYTIPEIGAVGLTEVEAASNGIEVITGRSFYDQNARAKIIGARLGLVKLVFDAATRKLLGVHIAGDHASELVHIGQAMIALGGTVDTLIDMVFNYPTLSESYKYAAYDALAGFNALEESGEDELAA